MDNGILMEVANTIRGQLYGMDRNLMWGLGANSFVAKVNEKGYPTLNFKVKGIKHKGFVDIALNEGMDLYEVRIYTVRKEAGKYNYVTKVKYEIDGIYFDQLPEILEENCY